MQRISEKAIIKILLTTIKYYNKYSLQEDKRIYTYILQHENNIINIELKTDGAKTFDQIDLLHTYLQNNKRQANKFYKKLFKEETLWVMKILLTW